MFIEILLAIFIGVSAGIFTGLTPGIHVNLVSILLFSSSPFLLQYASVLSLGCFIVAMAVTHTFLDSIPSIFLGAPDPAMAMGVLPGHRYLLEGRGILAVKLTLIGSLLGLLISVLFFPFFALIIKLIYPLVKESIGYLLLFVICFSIFRNKRRLWAFLLISLSGILGFIVLNLPGLQQPLFPLLSGLFGVSTLLLSLAETSFIPKQHDDEELTVKTKDIMIAIGAGETAGFLTSMLPGLGAAEAAAMATTLLKNLSRKAFMMLLGSINTVNFTLSLATLFILSKARNGAVVVINQLMEPDLDAILVFLAVALIAGCIATIIVLSLTKRIAKMLSKVDYKRLTIGIILLITLLTIILSGWVGLLVLFTATCLGILPVKVYVSRTATMGCLIVPVMIFFLF
ncbi:tripartite tricarboxylate transporter permease [Candidatus Woesearchaeota archaeon]|nr:MAG: hypothetical protein QS99_C0019G0026 [archaeon GW2011_AR4]MBS3130413.1 tripartite tricarboxylate transporter permease [Candidatus Woesearchaeota archaeon]HIH38676.1 hypothetical protein [Candidatus Woesearchaeota archaeon]HIH49610.1 hypothetical protein [Candidatus Woesearchaeota archaeon]HIJ03530.1 hypothetical protein [Candidatus Woesearchaeota archaeon]